MRSCVVALVLLLTMSVSAGAQVSVPRAELFGGYSFASAEGEPDRESFHGFGFSVVGNLTNTLGLVGDFSYHAKEIDEVDISAFTFLFGPRVSVRRDRTTAFAHFLIGAVRARAELLGVDESTTDLALGIGGGLDVAVNPRVSIRVAQFDYIPARFEDEFGRNNWSQNFRYQAGVVIRFGAR